MEVKLTVKPKSPDVPVEFIIMFSLLSAVALTGIGIPIALLGIFWLTLLLGLIAYCVKKGMGSTYKYPASFIR